MTTKPKLLKPKAQTKPSHNTGLQNLVDAVQKVPEVPLQVRLSEDLATRVKVYCAKNKITHKQLITSALEQFLPKEK
jgi:predicted DNA binding CopG/RHH family protein